MNPEVTQKKGDTIIAKETEKLRIAKTAANGETRIHKNR